MANHCSNWITLSGNPENLKKAVMFIREWLIEKYEHLPNQILTDIPLKEWNEAERKDPYTGFGTKWIIISEADLELSDNDDSISFQAESAWNPVNPFIKNLCIKFDINGENQYEEGGCLIYGVYDYTEGMEDDKTMSKGEYYRDVIPDSIDGELEYFDLDDYEDLKSVLSKEQKLKILSNEFCE